MTDLSQDAKHALRLARHAAEPSAEQLERIARSLRASLDGGVAGSPPGRSGAGDGPRLNPPHGADAATHPGTGAGQLAALGKSLTWAAAALGAGTLATWICIQAATPAPGPHERPPTTTISARQDERAEPAEPLVPSRSPVSSMEAPPSERPRELSARAGRATSARHERSAPTARGTRARGRTDAKTATTSLSAELEGAREHEGAPNSPAGAAWTRGEAPAPSTPASLARDTRPAALAPAKEPAREAGVAPRMPEQQVESSESLSREIPIIARAHALLTADKPKRAVALLDDYLHEFPRGTLRVEALVTRALCYCGLGAANEARAAIRELAANPAAAPHLARLRAACRPVAPDDF